MKEESSTIEKIEHSIFDTLVAAKDLISDTLDAVKETIVAPFTGENVDKSEEFVKG